MTFIDLIKKSDIKTSKKYVFQKSKILYFQVDKQKNLNFFLNQSVQINSDIIFIFHQL